MKFAAVVLILLASLFASLTHGMAAAPACVEMLSVDGHADIDGGDASGSEGAAASTDGAHCGFGMILSSEPHSGVRDYTVGSIGGRSADLLFGRDRMPDQRPPDLTWI